MWTVSFVLRNTAIALVSLLSLRDLRSQIRSIRSCFNSQNPIRVSCSPFLCTYTRSIMHFLQALSFVLPVTLAHVCSVHYESPTATSTSATISPTLTPPPVNIAFSAIAARSGSPFHLSALNAANGGIFLNSVPTSFCPIQIGSACPPGTFTYFEVAGGAAALGTSLFEMKTSFFVRSWR